MVCFLVAIILKHTYLICLKRLTYFVCCYNTCNMPNAEFFSQDIYPGSLGMEFRQDGLGSGSGSTPDDSTPDDSADADETPISITPDKHTGPTHVDASINDAIAEELDPRNWWPNSD
jgi:hypothetical protein